MRRLLLVTALAGAALAPAAPASATPCEVSYKGYCVSVCLTTDTVYHLVTGEHLACG